MRTLQPSSGIPQFSAPHYIPPDPPWSGGAKQAASKCSLLHWAVFKILQRPEADRYAGIPASLLQSRTAVPLHAFTVILKSSSEGGGTERRQVGGELQVLKFDGLWNSECFQCINIHTLLLYLYPLPFFQMLITNSAQTLAL